MNIIFFSDNYPKLHNQQTAELLAIKAIKIKKEKHKELLEYDTAKSDGTYYSLDEGDYVQLIFIGDKHIPFSTLRKMQPSYKLQHYKSLIGKDIKIVIKKDPKI